MQEGYAMEHPVSDKDTVIIRFGNSSRIVILVKDKEDLELLKQYDINGMLKDLKIAIDTAGDKNNLIIEDRTGETYLKDTTIVIEDVRIEVDDENEYVPYELIYEQLFCHCLEFLPFL